MNSQICLSQTPFRTELAQTLAKPDADVTPSTGHAPIMAVGFLLRIGHALQRAAPDLLMNTSPAHPTSMPQPNSLLALLRQAAWEKSFDDEEQNNVPALIVSNSVEQGNLLALEAASGAVEIASRPIVEAINKVATALIPQQIRDNIVKSLTLAADIYLGEKPHLAAAIQRRVHELRSSRIATIGDLRQIEVDALREVNRGLMAELNACLAFVYGNQGSLPIPVVWEEDAASQSEEFVAEIIRKHLYQHVQASTGVDLASAATKEVATRTFRTGLFKTYCEHVVPAQQDRVRKGYLRYVLTGSRYWSHPFWKRLWISNPTGYFNELFRSDIGLLFEDPQS